MGNSLLSEIGGNKGAKESFGDVGRKQLRVHWILLMIHYLFISCFVIFCFLYLLRKEHMVDQMCDETIL